MAKSIDISAPASFNIHEDPTNLGATWKKWKTKFGVYLTAANITDDNQSKALLLHCGGDDFLELFDTLPELDNLPDNTTENQKWIIKLDNHFLPPKHHFQ